MVAHHTGNLEVWVQVPAGTSHLSEKFDELDVGDVGLTHLPLTYIILNYFFIINPQLPDYMHLLEISYIYQIIQMLTLSQFCNVNGLSLIYSQLKIRQLDN